MDLRDRLCSKILPEGAQIKTAAHQRLGQEQTIQTYQYQSSQDIENSNSVKRHQDLNSMKTRRDLRPTAVVAFLRIPPTSLTIRLLRTSLLHSLLQSSHIRRKILRVLSPHPLRFVGFLQVLLQLPKTDP